MTIAWRSISISLTSGGSVIFNGYFSVDTTTNVIQNFYYVNNNQYVDILLRDLGDFGSDNQFVNNNFTVGGTNILSVIPYINTTYSNPYKLNLYFDITGINSIGYNPTNTYNVGWVDSPINFTFTFTSISGLPSLALKNKYNFGLFVRGKGGNHRIAAATINLGSTKGRGSSTRMFNYCTKRESNTYCINQFIKIK
jgi:hypothetical protein